MSAELSPDWQHVAAVFRRSCGATTGFSPQVSLVGPGERPSGLGNVFILADHDPAPRVEWLGPDRLRITYKRGAEIFLRESERDGVRIKYRAVGNQLHPLASGRDRDRYGRQLRIVTRNGRSLGDQLVREGLARTWSGHREPWS